MANHTPGPWAVGKSIANHQTVIWKPEEGPYDPRVHAVAFTVIRDQRSMEEIEANARLIARSPSMLALLEKALPIIEVEAERRDAAPGAPFSDREGYWREMRDLANEIAAEIDKARGKGVSDG